MPSKRSLSLNQNSGWVALLPLLLVFWTGWQPLPAQESQNFPVNVADGSVLEVTHLYTHLPPGGYTMVRVTVVNKGLKDYPVRVSSVSKAPGDHAEHLMKGGEVTFNAAAASTTAYDYMAPLMTDFSTRRSWNNGSLELRVDVAGGTQVARFSGGRIPDFPFVGVSQGSGGKVLAAVNEAARAKSGVASGYGEGIFAVGFSASLLPQDWRGLLGLDFLVLNPDEWNTLQPGVRTAIRQWACLGGVLTFYHNGPMPAAILQELNVESGGAEILHRLGAGEVRTVEWDGKDWGPDQARHFAATGRPPARLEIAANALKNGNKIEPAAGLVEAIGVRSFAAWQVGLILVIFGLLVGPVNLFYLAGVGRRHRLFYTTPLIALGASVVLVAVIFLQDGSGGSGRRAAIVELRPGENVSVIRQYQISRTGVLFGGGFKVAVPAAVTPLMMENSRWTRLKPGHSRDAESQQYNLPEPQIYGGDWFQSRSEQAQLVETILPGRGRFELKPDPGDPRIVSSFPAPVEHVFYQDASGKWWSGPGPLTTGGTMELTASTPEAFDSWLRREISIFPEAERYRIRKSVAPGKFYAASRDPQAGLVDTLESIEWESDYLLLHGRFTPVP